MSTLQDSVKGRGYWEFVVRPIRFEERKVPNISMLLPIVERCSVRIRGWDFPHVELGQAPAIGQDWIEESIDWEHYIESWRLFQSGQFYYLRALWEDWRDRSGSWPAGAGWRPMSRLGVGDVVDTCTELFEFASRLSQTEAGDDQFSVQAVLMNTKSRALHMDRSRRGPLHSQYVATIPSYPYRRELARTELIARPRELALELAKEIFERFGWNPHPVILRWLQEEMGKV